MIEEVPFTEEELHARSIRTRKNLTWLIVMAVVMFFAGLTSAYVVSMSSGYWVDIAMPKAFLWSTLAIVASSVFAQIALLSAAKGRKSMITPMLAITLVLGLVFTWSQFQGWKELVRRGNFMVGKVIDTTGEYGVDYTVLLRGVPLIKENGNFYQPTDVEGARPLNADLEEQMNTSSSFFFALTAAHLAHIAFGLISLLVMIAMAAMGRYVPADHVGLWAGTMFWHFLGGLWVYLLLFLTFVH